METPAREHWLARDGVRLYAVEEGPPSGRPILLLHGGLADHHSCWLYARPLTARFRVITPDLRGAGRSHFAGALTWDAIADDLAALVHDLGLADVVVGGASFGAGAATAFALRHPALVSALAILMPAYGGAELGLSPAQGAAMDAMHAYGQRAPTEGIEVMFPLLDTLPVEIRARARALVATFDPASIAATTAFMASGAQPFARGTDLAALTMPALVLPGTDATHPREVADVFARHIPHATVRDCELPAYAAAIEAFLE